MVIAILELIKEAFSNSLNFIISAFEAQGFYPYPQGRRARSSKHTKCAGGNNFDLANFIGAFWPGNELKQAAVPVTMGESVENPNKTVPAQAGEGLQWPTIENGLP